MRAFICCATLAAVLQSAAGIPTTDEAGLPGFHRRRRTQCGHRGTLADRGAQRLDELGQDIPRRDRQTPEALGAHHKAEIEKWWPVIKAAKIKAE